MTRPPLAWILRVLLQPYKVLRRARCFCYTLVPTIPRELTLLVTNGSTSLKLSPLKTITHSSTAPTRALQVVTSITMRGRLGTLWRRVCRCSCARSVRHLSDYCSVADWTRASPRTQVCMASGSVRCTSSPLRKMLQTVLRVSCRSYSAVK